MFEVDHIPFIKMLMKKKPFDLCFFHAFRWNTKTDCKIFHLNEYSCEGIIGAATIPDTNRRHPAMPSTEIPKAGLELNINYFNV